MLDSARVETERSYRLLRDEEVKTGLKVQAGVSNAIRDFLDAEEFLELSPPLVGPVTDPGIRGAKQATFEFYGHEYKLMSSVILYKQAAVSALDRIYYFATNIRMEPPETADSARHLCEFIQVDLEMAHADYHDAMDVAEGLFKHVCAEVKKTHYRELEELGRSLPTPETSFPRLTHREAVERLDDMGFDVDYHKEIPWDQEKALSAEFETPFFIYDYPKGSRGFYDLEDPDRPGILRDFDMLYPEGYGEAVSGAEREYEYGAVIERMRETGENPSKYGWYLEMLRDGIPPSAGFGIGLERLTRYVCGFDSILKTRPFPKVPGTRSP